MKFSTHTKVHSFTFSIFTATLLIILPATKASAQSMRFESVTAAIQQSNRLKIDRSVENINPIKNAKGKITQARAKASVILWLEIDHTVKYTFFFPTYKNIVNKYVTVEVDVTTRGVGEANNVVGVDNNGNQVNARQNAFQKALEIARNRAKQLAKDRAKSNARRRAEVLALRSWQKMSGLRSELLAERVELREHEASDLIANLATDGIQGTYRVQCVPLGPHYFFNVRNEYRENGSHQFKIVVYHSYHESAPCTADFRIKHSYVGYPILEMTSESALRYVNLAEVREFSASPVHLDNFTEVTLDHTVDVNLYERSIRVTALEEQGIRLLRSGTYSGFFGDTYQSCASDAPANKPYDYLRVGQTFNQDCRRRAIYQIGQVQLSRDRSFQNGFRSREAFLRTGACTATANCFSAAARPYYYMSIAQDMVAY